MKIPTTRGTERKTDRLEAFSDAVLAIAITLPIVELHSPEVPHGGALSAAYAALASKYVAYALSVLVIGLYWTYSHFSGKLFRKTDHGFNLLTVAFLAVVSVTPFASRPFLEHLHDPANIHVAASVYAGLLSAPSLVWLARWLYAVRRGLLDPHLAESYLRKVTVRYVATASTYALGFVLTVLADWRIGMALIALITLTYLLPPTAPVFKRGEAPEHDLQEADERDAPSDTELAEE